jgi:hypothetical protein
MRENINVALPVRLVSSQPLARAHYETRVSRRGEVRSVRVRMRRSDPSSSPRRIVLGVDGTRQILADEHQQRVIFWQISSQWWPGCQPRAGQLCTGANKLMKLAGIQ